MRPTAALLGTLAITAALGLSACGSDGGSKKPGAGAAESYSAKSVKQIEADAVAAMSKVRSLRVKSRYAETDQGTVAFDVVVTRSGDCTGHFDIAGEGRADIRQVDGRPYIRWSKELWDHVGGDAGIAAEAIVGRWVDLSAKEDLIDSMCDLDKLLMGLKETSDPSGDAVIGTSTYRGTSTVKIRSHGDGGEVETAQISATPPHYILRVDSTQNQFVAFSEFGKPVTVKAPAKDEILDLSSLSG